MLFIGTSNQMGETESGFVAYYTTPKFAAVSGGIGTILVVIAAALLWPELRKQDRLDETVPMNSGKEPEAQVAK